MKNIIYGLVASIVLPHVATNHAMAADLKILSSWDQSYAAVGEVLMPFMEYLENETTENLKDCFFELFISKGRFNSVFCEELGPSARTLPNEIVLR